MGVLAWILFGLLAGAVAKILVPGDDFGGGGIGGIIVTIAVGIIGAFVGGWMGTELGFGTVTGFNITSFAIAVLGAIVFLLILRAVSSGGRRIA
jgi:uncharacterized membrane protein YeaQ/YmgE (transglycosylase-associated protein family)